MLTHHKIRVIKTAAGSIWSGLVTGIVILTTPGCFMSRPAVRPPEAQADAGPRSPRPQLPSEQKDRYAAPKDGVSRAPQTDVARLIAAESLRRESPRIRDRPAPPAPPKNEQSRLFTETVTNFAAPVLSVTNTTSGPDTLSWGIYGQEHVVPIPAGGTRMIRMAQGTYRVELKSQQNLYRTWSGQATFRAFHKYSVSYTIASDGPPLHIGE